MENIYTPDLTEVPKNTTNTEAEEKASMTKAERERSERNRMKALNLKKARLMAHPYSKNNDGKLHKSDQPKLVDSGGGFFVEEKEGEEAQGNMGQYTTK